MPKKYDVRNRHTEWSDEDIRRLRDLAAGGTPTGVIALRLDRSKAAVLPGPNAKRKNGLKAQA
jgi:hypothetical protein